MELAMAGKTPQFYMGFDEDKITNPAALEMLRAFQFAMAEAKAPNYGPTLTVELDHTPVTEEEVLAIIAEGKITLGSMDPKCDESSIKEVVNRFLRKEATFSDLKAAVGLEEMK
jgi:hypothetical protein